MKRSFLRSSLLAYVWISWPFLHLFISVILFFFKSTSLYFELPRWLIGKESAWQCRRCRRLEFDPWVSKIPWGRKWQATLSFLAWRILWTEEPGGLQSMGSQRVRYNLVTELACKLVFQCWLQASARLGRQDTLTALIISIVLSFSECHLTGITWYVTFSNWLLSFSNLHLGFFHVVLWLDKSSFKVKK